MDWYWPALVSLTAALVGAILGGRLSARADRSQGPTRGRKPLRPLLERHFRPAALDDLTVSERRFPFRVRADLQRAVDRLFTSAATITHFCGVRKENTSDILNFASL